ncbi:MAG: PKD domain-containing protein [Patescibacteria group bacterium]
MLKFLTLPFGVAAILVLITFTFNTNLNTGTQLAASNNCPTPDLDHDSDIDLDDLLKLTDAFANGYTSCPDCDIAPCPGNKDIDIDDIIAFLDAFAAPTNISTIPHGSPANFTQATAGYSPDSTYEWRFGDCTVRRGKITPGTAINWSHIYSLPGDYQPILQVTQNGIITTIDQLPITVTPDPANATLTANYTAYRLASTNAEPTHGTCADGKVWEEIDLQDDDTDASHDQIELGLKVRLDARSSVGQFDRDSWGLPYGGTRIIPGVVEYQFPDPNVQRQVSLTVRRNNPYVSDVVFKTVHVATSMDFIARMYPPIDPVTNEIISFRANQNYVIEGNKVWLMSGSNDRLGLADLSNPYSLPRIRLMPVTEISEVIQMFLSDGLLYLARGTRGLDIYRADPDNFVLLSHVSPQQLGSTSISRVGAVKGHVFALAAFKIFPINITNVSSPIVGKELPLGTFLLGHVPDLIQVNSEALIVHDGGTKMQVVDIRIPTSPLISFVLDIPQVVGRKMNLWRNNVIISTLSGLVFLEYQSPTQIKERFTLANLASVGGSLGLSSVGRLYLRHYTSGGNEMLDKYDITAPDSAYLMKSSGFFTTSQGPVLVLDPDDDGPLGEFIYLTSEAYGFQSRTP